MILFTADIHFRESLQWGNNEHGMNNILADVIDSMREIYKIASKNDVSHIMILGDLYHSQRSHVSKNVILETYNCIKGIAKKFEVIILMGNHDVFMGSKTLLSALDSIPNVTVIRKPTHLCIDGYKFHAVPFIADPEEFRNVVRSGVDDEILLFHQFIHGAKVHENFSPKADIAQSDVENYKYAIGGDIHKPQQLGKRIIYTGSPMQHNFGEKGEEKRILLLGDKLESVPLHTAQFREVNISTKKELEDFKEHYTDDYYKVILGAEGLDDLPESNKIRVVPYIKELEEIEDIGRVDSFFDRVVAYAKEMDLPEKVRVDTLALVKKYLDSTD